MVLTRKPVLAFGFVLIALALAVVLFPRSEATAQAQDAKAAVAPATTAAPLTELKIVERVTRATDKAMVYLASKQRPDGSWANGHAFNALSLLAFMGRGHVPGRGPYKDVLEKGKRYILGTQDPTGYFAADRMYGHGLATLALAEMYGMDPDPVLEEKLRKAVDLIIKIQSPGGGWNYGPAPGEGDLSVSVMQIVALRAANNAEMPVPEQVINKAIGYVRARANPGGGGYGYAGPGAGPQTSAAGALSLQLLGKPEDPHIAKTLEYLARDVPISWGPGSAQYFYYFHYYAIQANYQAGGKFWNDWHPRIRELLLEKQNPDGSWDCPPGTAELSINDKTYWTAMACLVLDIYMHFLPAYQR